MLWIVALILIVILGVTSIVVSAGKEPTQANMRRDTGAKFCAKHQGVKRYNKYNLWCNDDKTIFWWDNGQWGQVSWRPY